MAFELEQRTAIERARDARPASDRAAAARATPDPRPFARKFLELAREARDEGVAVDALVWVVRHAGRTPEQDEAIGRIADRFIRSDRIAGTCWPIAAKGETGEKILRRIVEENADPNVRGQACLGLVFAQRMMLRDVRRYQVTPAERRNEWLNAYGQGRVDRLEKADPAVLISEAERWAERMLADFPTAVLNPEVSDFFPILSEEPGRGAETVLRRAAEEHRDPRTRQEATCAWLVQQMRLAPLLAVAASKEAGARHGGPSADVPGGATGAKALDPGRLAAEIDGRLRGLADTPDVPPQPPTAEIARTGLNLHHLLAELGTNRGYHVGADRFLRRVAEAHTDGRVRTLARRSLALHLTGLAETSAQLRFAAGADLAYWLALLGEDRVRQVRGLDPVQLNREARGLAERVSAERQPDRGGPDRAIEAILRTSGGASVGMVSPEIEGEDVEGVRFKLSDHRGKVVLLDFWNHRGCPPCRDAYPKLRALVKEFAGSPFVLLGVDTDDERADLARLVADGVVTWRSWFKHGTEAEPTFARWHVGGVPTLILLDHRGVVRVRYEGTPSGETLGSAIKALIEEARDAG